MDITGKRFIQIWQTAGLCCPPLHIRPIPYPLKSSVHQGKQRVRVIDPIQTWSKCPLICWNIQRWEGGLEITTDSLSGETWSRKQRPPSRGQWNGLIMWPANSLVTDDQKLLRECLKWRQLHHPNVLEILGVDTTTLSNMATFVQPWREHNIREHIKKASPIPATKALVQWVSMA